LGVITTSSGAVVAMNESKGLDLYEKVAQRVCTVCFAAFAQPVFRWQKSRKYNAPGVDNPVPEFQLAASLKHRRHSYREPFDWRRRLSVQDLY